MKVSIITVCKNAEEGIEKTIRSVITQGYPNIEYIIVDGNSTDNTLRTIEDFRDSIHYLLSEEDSGVYDAMNKGINIADGEILQFLNAGDFLLHENVIGMVVDSYRECDPDILYGDTLVYDREGWTGVRRYFDVDKYYLYHNMVNHQSIFYKASVFRNHGLYDESYRICADHEHLVRLFCDKSLKTMYLSKGLVVFNLLGLCSDMSLKDVSRDERRRMVAKYYTRIERIVYGCSIYRAYRDCLSVLRRIRWG